MYDGAICREIGRRLKGERERQGLSQRDLAALAGVTCATVSNVERAAYACGVVVLYRLAAGLGVPAKSLLPDEPPEYTGDYAIWGGTKCGFSLLANSQAPSAAPSPPWATTPGRATW